MCKHLAHQSKNEAILFRNKAIFMLIVTPVNPNDIINEVRKEFEAKKLT